MQQWAQDESGGLTGKVPSLSHVKIETMTKPLIQGNDDRYSVIGKELM
jgi:hypothetical protein